MTGYTLLHTAVYNNDITLLKKLLTVEGIEVDALAFNERTALQLAKKCNFRDAQKFLSQQGADSYLLRTTSDEEDSDMDA